MFRQRIKQRIKFNFAIIASFIVCTHLFADENICNSSLAGLQSTAREMLASKSPSSVSVPLFLQTYENIIEPLAESDLNQLVLHPFTLAHPSESLLHKEADLLLLMEKRLHQVLPEQDPEYKKIINAISGLVHDRIKKSIRTAAALELESKQTPLTPEVKQLATLPQQAYSVAYSPDGKTLASASLGIIRFLDVKTGATLHTNKASIWGWILKIAYSPDGKYFAAITQTGFVLRWNAITHQAFSFFHSNFSSQFSSLAFSPDGKKLAVSTTRGEAFILNWNSDWTSNEVWKKIPSTGGQALAFSADGKYLATGGNQDTFIRGFSLWSLKHDLQPRTFQSHAEVLSMSFSPNGRWLAVEGEDKRIAIWNTKNINLKFVHFLELNFSSAKKVVFSPDSKKLAVGYEDGRISLWDPETGSHLKTIYPAQTFFNSQVDKLLTLDFSPDNRQIAYGTFSGQVNFWRTDDEE